MKNNVTNTSGSIVFREEIDATLVIALFMNPNTRKKEYSAATTASDTLLTVLFTIMDEVSFDCSCKISCILTRSPEFVG